MATKSDKSEMKDVRPIQVWTILFARTWVALLVQVVICASALDAPAAIASASTNPTSSSSSLNISKPSSSSGSAATSTPSGGVSGVSGGSSLSVPGIAGGSINVNLGGGASAGAASPRSGGLGGFLDGLGDAVGSIRGLLDQFQQLRRQVSSRFSNMVGNGRNGFLQGLQESLGKLNLPDPTEVFDQLFGDRGRSTRTREFARESSDGVNSVVDRDILQSNINAEAAQQNAAQMLSKDAQTARVNEAKQVEGMIGGAASQNQGTANLAGQSADASAQAEKLAQEAEKFVQESQNRVSTQDAVKDLSRISGNMSRQLAQLSTQQAAQSGQLSNISGQLSTAVTLEGQQLVRLQELSTGVALANQNLADINRNLQSQRRMQAVQTTAQIVRSLQAGRLANRTDLGGSGGSSRNASRNASSGSANAFSQLENNSRSGGGTNNRQRRAGANNRRVAQQNQQELEAQRPRRANDR